MCDLESYLLSSHFSSFLLGLLSRHYQKTNYSKEAEIKSPASAASLGFAGERQDDAPACGRRGTGRSPANPREAALAADLITVSSIRLLAVPGQYYNENQTPR